MAASEGELGRRWVGAKEGNRRVMQQDKMYLAGNLQLNRPGIRTSAVAGYQYNISSLDIKETLGSERSIAQLLSRLFSLRP